MFPPPPLLTIIIVLALVITRPALSLVTINLVQLQHMVTLLHPDTTPPPRPLIMDMDTHQLHLHMDTNSILHHIHHQHTLSSRTMKDLQLVAKTPPRPGASTTQNILAMRSPMP